MLYCVLRWTFWRTPTLGHYLLDSQVAWRCICAVLQRTVFNHAPNSHTMLHSRLTMPELGYMALVVSLCTSSIAVRHRSMMLPNHTLYLLVAFLPFWSVSAALCQRFAMKDHIRSHARYGWNFVLSARTNCCVLHIITFRTPVNVGYIYSCFCNLKKIDSCQLAFMVLGSFQIYWTCWHSIIKTDELVGHYSFHLIIIKDDDLL